MYILVAPQLCVNMSSVWNAGSSFTGSSVVLLIWLRYLANKRTTKNPLLLRIMETLPHALSPNLLFCDLKYERTVS